MKKILAGLFLFLFAFQIAVFADTPPPVAPESKFKAFMAKAVQTVWDYTYLALQKVGIA